jgi:hypothetical protein
MGFWFQVFFGFRFLVSEKSGLHIWGWHHTLVSYSKPFVSVVGNPIINKIPDKIGDENKNIKQWPQPIQSLCNLQSSAASIKGFSIMQEHYTVKLSFAESMLLEQLTPNIGLQRSKTQLRIGVMLDNELNAGVTQIANTIE